MGSGQSRNEYDPHNGDIKIIITSADDEADFISENEDNEEFFECLTDFNFDDVEYRDNNKNDSSSGKSEENEIEKHCENKTLSHSYNESESIQEKIAKSEDDDDEDESGEERKERLRKELDEFRKDLLEKRSLCQHSINKWRIELTELREKYNKEILLNEQLREMMEERGINALASENRQLKLELAECQMFLQTSNSENITATMENQALRDHVRSLKEVIKATKEMLAIRECQVNQLKSKLTEIENSFSEKEAKIMSTELQKEYHRQLDNIRHMRELYEERANLLTKERDKLKAQLEEKEQDMKTEIEKSKNLQEHIGIVEENIKHKNTDISMLENEISQMKFEKEKVLTEMNALNQLLAQVLYDFNASGNKIDLENLYKMLEQNRTLLNEMTSKEDYAIGLDDEKLPKLLYDLFLQVNKTNNNENGENVEDNDDKKDRVSSPVEIANKLPKVWQILNEFLSHDKFIEDEEEKSADDTQTANASSVSKTFIRLRDLILQKRSLQKDTGRLKTLYSHLEQRLDKQEKRLSSVSLELTKTWHAVGKIKRQNRQLHTHEQILCYQLQQKRRLLNELKAELEYCRKKWALARAINSDSEIQLEQMRHEFAQRKILDKNSAESGYGGDEHVSDLESDEFCKSEKGRIERFNKNLLTFDKIETTVCDEPILYANGLRKSRSESTLFNNFVTSPILTHAQSEPQHIYDPEENEDVTCDLDNYVVLVPNTCVYDSLQSRIVDSDDDISQQQSLVITLPPKIYKHDTKRALSKSKKKKKKSKISQNNGQGESAEAMFMRLLSSMNNEEQSQTTSSASSLEEEEDNIPEIPVDEAIIEVEVPEEIKEESNEAPSSPEVDTTANSVPTADDDYLKRREIRLSRLEAEAKEFYERMSRNREKGVQLNNHLDSVHQNFLDRQKKEKDKGESSSSSSGNTKKKDDSDKSDENDKSPNN